MNYPCEVYPKPGANISIFLIYLSVFPILFSLSLMIIIYSYIKTTLLVKKMSKETMGLYDFKSRKLLIYPLIHMIIYAPLSLFYFFAIFKIADEFLVSFLGPISTYCIDLAGFLNFLAYGTQVIYKKRKLKRKSMMSHNENYNILEEESEESLRTFSRSSTGREERDLIEALNN